MAESYYTSAASSSPAEIPQSPISPSGPPPPPPPKPSSHEPSRTSTPQTLPFNPNTYQNPPPPPPPPHTYSQTGPPAPPVPPSSSHAHALTKQQQQQSTRYQDTNTYTSTASPRPSYEQGFTAQDQQQQHQQHQQQQQPSPQVYHSRAVPPPPFDSGWLPEGLSNKSTAELQPLIHNAALLTAFAHQHPSYQSSVDPLQAAISANLTLAQQVASLETQVKHLRDQTGQLLINHTSLQTQWRRKQSEMDNALSPWGPRAMYQRLVSSIAEQEALLRAVHESFLEGGEDGDNYYSGQSTKASEKEITEWVKRIREGTTVLEKRREMRARWDEGRVGGWR